MKKGLSLLLSHIFVVVGLFGQMLFFPLCAQTVSEQQPFRICAGKAVALPLVEKRAELEKKIGFPVEIRMATSAQCLVALQRGVSDMALIGGGFTKTLQGAHRSFPSAIPQKHRMEVFPIGNAIFYFAVHEKNPVGELTLAQVEEICLGNINNWMDVGVGDSPIAPIIQPQGTAARNVMDNFVLKGRPPSGGAVLAASQIEVLAFLRANHNGLGFLSESCLAKGVKKVSCETVFEDVVEMVTIGPPGAEQKKIIEAAGVILSLEQKPVGGL